MSTATQLQQPRQQQTTAAKTSTAPQISPAATANLSASSSTVPGQGMVKLRSQDEKEYILPRKVCYQSKVLKGFIEASTPTTGIYGAERTCADTAPMVEIPLPLIRSEVLDLVVLYLSERHASNASMTDFLPLQRLDPEKEADRKLVLDLLLAADFLEC